MALRLAERVLVGRAALRAELALIGVLALGVVAVHALVGRLDLLLVPLVALGLGAAGALAGGSSCVGSLRTPGYPATYVAVITLMLALDLALRAWLGGALWLVPCNWAVLIGSASAVNLAVTHLPWLSAARYVDGRSIGSLHPVGWVIVIALQVAQAWISVLGATLGIALLQLALRRLAILPLVHAIARRRYGPDHAARLRAGTTLEYLALRSVADVDGRVEEPDLLERSVVGTVLLKLPIFGGESMTAGRASLARVGDKLVFVEQMLAFSSPTMVVAPAIALGHAAFMYALLGLAGEGHAPPPSREHAKACVDAALAGAPEPAITPPPS
jgi:hypothetical protein